MKSWAAVLAALVALAPSAASLGAQTIHLPPTYRSSPPAGHSALSIRLKTPLTSGQGDGGTVAAASGSVSINGGELVLRLPNKTTNIPLGGRTLQELVSFLNEEFGAELTADTKYPSFPASALRALTKSQDLTVIDTLSAGDGVPELRIGVGVVMSLADDVSGAGGLLAQTGFQLDVSGIYQFAAGPDVSTSDKLGGLLRRVGKRIGNPDAFLQLRFGAGSNQQLASETSVADSTDAATQAVKAEAPTTFEAALESANQLALTGQLDFAWPINTAAAVSLSLGGGVAWVQLDDFILPAIEVRDSVRSASELFEAGRVSRVTKELNRTLPVSELGANLIMQFTNGSTPVFYGGGGIVFKEVVERDIRFARTADGTPIASSFEGTAEGDLERHWRAIFGARVPGFPDFRIDATGPIGDRKAEPLFRLVIGKNFPTR